VDELPVHNFIFQHSRRHCPNIYYVLEPASVSPSHRSLPPDLWTTSWLLLAPHHRRRTFSQRDVTLDEETSGNHNVTINSNNLFVNLRWTFTFWVEKSYDGTHLAFGGTLDRRCHFKHVSLKIKPVLPLSKEHGSQVKDQGRRQCCHNKLKNFPIGLHVIYISTFRTRLVHWPLPSISGCRSSICYLRVRHALLKGTHLSVTLLLRPRKNLRHFCPPAWRTWSLTPFRRQSEPKKPTEHKQEHNLLYRISVLTAPHSFCYSS